MFGVREAATRLSCLNGADSNANSSFDTLKVRFPRDEGTSCTSGNESILYN